MTELALVYFQVLFLISHYHRRNAVSLLLCLYAVCVLPTAVVGERTAFLNIDQSNRMDAGLGSLHDDTPKFRDRGADKENSFQVVGSFARVGAIRSAEGLLQRIIPYDEKDGSMEKTLQEMSLQRDWVAVLELPAGSSNTEPNLSQEQSVLDRVRKVVMFGASAIIILAMNPKMVTELDVVQLFPCPVVLIQEVENVTALLSALASKIKMKVRLTYNASFYDLQKISTLTLWATCGRSGGFRPYSEFDGVICLGDPNQDVSKADPALFWSYFLSGMSFLLLLFIAKANHGAEDIIPRAQSSQSLQRLTQQAISQMKVKRYQPHASRNHDDSDRDTCAVCLDGFCRKQKIRVMPCFHEFHVGCVDPWLKLHQTCPLCKLNIIDQQIKLDAL